MSRIVSCPTCSASVQWTEQNPTRPFCSERCKLIDLGAWASESYRVAADGDALDFDHNNETEQVIKSS
jgi:hypothetical protein